MANRRMFSRRVISSARFMKLTKDAQVLYFHLCLNADDDGAVEGFPVRRSIGIEEDAYANLEGRGFIIVLDRENEIVYITDWYEHNKIRPDRIQPSMYRPLIEQAVSGVHLIEPKRRSDLKTPIDVSAGTEGDGQPMDSQGADDGQQMDGQWTDTGLSMDGQWSDDGRSMDGPRTVNGRPRIGKDRLGKVRLSEDKTGEENNGASAPTRSRFQKPTVQEVEAYCREKGYAHVDAEYFWNYYENINWHIGKNKMKNWRLAVANWEKRQKEFVSKKTASTPIMQHTEQENEEPWGWDE